MNVAEYRVVRTKGSGFHLLLKPTNIFRAIRKRVCVEKKGKVTYGKVAVLTPCTQLKG